MPEGAGRRGWRQSLQTTTHVESSSLLARRIRVCQTNDAGHRENAVAGTGVSVKDRLQFHSNPHTDGPACIKASELPLDRHAQQPRLQNLRRLIQRGPERLILRQNDIAV